MLIDARMPTPDGAETIRRMRELPSGKRMRVVLLTPRGDDAFGSAVGDLRVDGHIQRVGASKVPMLRVADSRAIAEHAASLGLIANAARDPVAHEVQRDRNRPELGEAAMEAIATPEAAPSKPAD